MAAVSPAALSCPAPAAPPQYGSPHQEPCRDPLLYDALLSREGLRRVHELTPVVAELAPQPEVVLVSPLSRCAGSGGAPQGARAGRRGLWGAVQSVRAWVAAGSRRCLQTAVVACHGLRRAAGVRLVAEPLLRERLTLSSEIGREPQELRADFPE